ncbi:class I adenylate-forming enzyme family protein [Symbioplanes lichenis]|uniref:class I adenylate-forming enzyme family protein n=1 Tax=Symbioplanes lichenis TaxID=1629072 RepID=UPI002739341C|nr:class I adenylate-forming enzyme family protein [Actinoplanes lichenis]
MTAPALEPARIARFLAGIVEIGGAATAPISLDRAVGELDRCGVRPGSVVLIAMPNSRDMLTVFFAVLLLGAVPAAASPSASSARLRLIADRIGGAVVVGPRLSPERLAGVRHRRLATFDVVTRDGAVGATRPGPTVVLLTSGTRGIASGCVHALDRLRLNAERHAAVIGQRDRDNVLITLPLHYSYALVAQALSAYWQGARVTLAGPPFTPGGYLRLLAGTGATVSSLTPALVRLLAGPGDLRLPGALRVLTVGGDALEPALTGGLLAANPGLEVYLTYGLTECGPRVATLAAHHEPARRHGSAGVPLPGVRTRLRRHGAEGTELLVVTDTAMLGRVGDVPPEQAGDQDGVVATGDLFDRDDDGYLWFRGRRSDFVVINDAKVSLRSVRRTAVAVAGAVRARTTVHRTESGETWFDLDLYVPESSTRPAASIKRSLDEVLLRAERPRHLTMHPVGAADWPK